MRKPIPPVEPQSREPKKEILVSFELNASNINKFKSKDFTSFVKENVTSGYGGTLSNELTELSDNINWGEVEIYISSDYYGSYFSAEVPCINKLYDQQLQEYENYKPKYEKELAKYRIKMEKYHSDLKIWEEEMAAEQQVEKLKKKKELKSKIKSLQKELDLIYGAGNETAK